MTMREQVQDTVPHQAPLLNQRRAAFALAKVREAMNQPEAHKFRQLLEGFPALVRQTGIGQAVALQMSNPRRPEACRILAALNEWLTAEGQPLAAVQGGLLMDRLMQAPRHVYLSAQEEALAICGWLKTFAQALLPKEE